MSRIAVLVGLGRAMSSGSTDASGMKHPVTAQGEVGMFQNIKLAQGLTADMISIGQLCDQTGRNILLTSDAAYLLGDLLAQRLTTAPRWRALDVGRTFRSTFAGFVSQKRITPGNH